MDHGDASVREIAELASRLALWPAGTLTSRAQDLTRIRDFLALIEREVLDGSAATIDPDAVFF